MKTARSRGETTRGRRTHTGTFDLTAWLNQEVNKWTRPSMNGLSNVVHLSKESLRAIEEAGADCSSGKRGGPRLNYDELDPKRRRFLERNRMAAARCRERKKQWIISLEYKANVSAF